MLLRDRPRFNAAPVLVFELRVACICKVKRVREFFFTLSRYKFKVYVNRMLKLAIEIVESLCIDR